MCNKWHRVEKDVGPCKVQIFGNPYGNVVVTGQMKDILEKINKIYFGYLNFVLMDIICIY